MWVRYYNNKKNKIKTKDGITQIDLSNTKDNNTNETTMPTGMYIIQGEKKLSNDQNKNGCRMVAFILYKRNVV